jgi:phosphosulfolactate synthase (CoM biosynthesis protein A)
MKTKQPERSFSFLRVNEREGKPGKRGLTEIRGPYYSVVGRRYLEDLFETMGADSLKFAGGFGMEKLMFEAADPDVFAWYIKNYGPDVNLFIDHSQIVQLECLRAGIWGTKSLWGRVMTYRE